MPIVSALLGYAFLTAFRLCLFGIQYNAQRHESNFNGSTYRGQRKSDNYNQMSRPYMGNQSNHLVKILMVDSTKGSEREKNQSHKQRPCLPL